MGLSNVLKQLASTRELGFPVVRPAQVYTAATDIFVVSGGGIELTSLVGEVTAGPMPAHAITTLISSVPTVGAAKNLCVNTTDLDSAAVGQMIALNGIFDGVTTFTGQMSHGTAIGYLLTCIFIRPGTIRFTPGATTGPDGQIKWTLYYVPYEAGAAVAPA